MMTQQLGFSILQAPLAAIDRRALSQAWLSVLERRTEPSHERATSTHLGTQTLRSSARGVGEARIESRPRVAEHIVRAVDRRERPRLEAEGRSDRRATRSPLAREIERAFLHPTNAPQRTSFTLQNGMRVHVQLRGGSDGMHLVAVCPPSERTAVAEALAQARYALARRGIALHTEVR